jgi:transposase-like protein
MRDEVGATIPERKLRKFTNEQRKRMVAEGVVGGACVTEVV